MKGSVREEELLIEFPEELFEMEEPEELEEQENENEPIIPSQQNNLTNVASNRLANEKTTTSAEDFFDDEFLKEIENAKQLVSDVNNQLSKEVVDLSDIKMPVETTEGMDPDSIKNIIYTGESNIVYYLENRYHISLPIPVYLSQGGGKVVVNIVVNRQGKVTEATPIINDFIRDKQIFLYAQEAALRTVFNEDLTAPARQEGSIHYTFVAQ